MLEPRFITPCFAFRRFSRFSSLRYAARLFALPLMPLLMLPVYYYYATASRRMPLLLLRLIMPFFCHAAADYVFYTPLLTSAATRRRAIRLCRCRLRHAVYLIVAADMMLLLMLCHDATDLRAP